MSTFYPTSRFEVEDFVKQILASCLHFRVRDVILLRQAICKLPKLLRVRDSRE